MDKLKYARSMTLGKSSMPSTEERKREDFAHCSFFFLSKNTQLTIVYSKFFSKK